MAQGDDRSRGHPSPGAAHQACAEQKPLEEPLAYGGTWEGDPAMKLPEGRGQPGRARGSPEGLASLQVRRVDLDQAVRSSRALAPIEEVLLQMQERLASLEAEALERIEGVAKIVDDEHLATRGNLGRLTQRLERRMESIEDRLARLDPDGAEASDDKTSHATKEPRSR